MTKGRNINDTLQPMTDKQLPPPVREAPPPPAAPTAQGPSAGMGSPQAAAKEIAPQSPGKEAPGKTVDSQASHQRPARVKSGGPSIPVTPQQPSPQGSQSTKEDSVNQANAFTSSPTLGTIVRTPTSITTGHTPIRLSFSALSAAASGTPTPVPVQKEFHSPRSPGKAYEQVEHQQLQSKKSQRQLLEPAGVGPKGLTNQSPQSPTALKSSQPSGKTSALASWRETSTVVRYQQPSNVSWWEYALLAVFVIILLGLIMTVICSR